MEHQRYILYMYLTALKCYTNSIGYELGDLWLKG